MIFQMKISKNYDKRDDFDFENCQFPILDGDVPRTTSYGVYIFQLIHFARASSHVADFNTRNNCKLRNFLIKALVSQTSQNLFLIL